MRSFSSLPRPLLLAMAVLFAAIAIVYSVVWMYYIRILPQNGIGVAFAPYSPGSKELVLLWVAHGSPADRGGLIAGDRILAIDGRPIETTDVWINAVLRRQPGSTIVFAVADRSSRVNDRRITVPVLPRELVHPTRIQSAIMYSLLSYPVFFIAVGFFVLFMRLEDGTAWLLALLFGGFVGLPGWVTPETEFLVPVSVRQFALAYHFACRDATPALFYCFFAVFPVSSPLDRRLPWLKWVLIGAAALAGAPMIATVLTTGSYARALTLAQPGSTNFASSIARLYGLGAFVLGLVSLTWNGLSAPTVESRRKVRVLMVGTVIGLAPLLIMSAVLFRSYASPLTLPFWTWVGGVAGLLLVPVSFAYAVLKHRVMEIPVLLRRSARYLLVRRGFALFISLASVAAAWAVAEFFSGFLTALFGPEPTMMITGFSAAGFGGILALTGAGVQRRVRDRLDRAFFRSAHDARQILEDLAQRIRSARSCSEVAALLGRQIRGALHPVSLAVYIESADGYLTTDAEGVPPHLRTVVKSAPVFEEMSARGRPLDATLPGSSAFAAFEPLRPECLVPMLARDGSLVGAVILGQRLSEEPYSGEDKRLLASVANQSGLAIESIRLAEAMAQRLEDERRAAQELVMARLVQSRLLLHRTPPLRTLEYAGRCVQARAVGGDYYDFLDLGCGRLGLALADVSGKGMPAALLMATVQAALRTHCTAGNWDLSAVTGQVNRLLFESTSPEHFVTLFVGDYDDRARRLRYVNCGHNPAIVIRHDGAVQRLAATACIVGAFRDWECAMEETCVCPGDLLALFTDGITEAANDRGEEFGDDRLINALREYRREPLNETIAAVIRTVQEFGNGDQADDQTMILARGR